ncbi:MAG: hypothetical protein MUF84_13970 [Anaerolineae bacterium]|nr:hypothetical protein [Anaerolineae bacterium]
MDKVAIIGLEWASGPGEDLETLAQMAYAGTPISRPGEGRTACSAGSRTGPAERLLRLAVDDQRGVRIGAIACGFEGAAGAAKALVVSVHGPSEEHFALGLERLDPIAALEVGQAWLLRRLVDLVVVVCEDALGSGALLLARNASVPRERIYALLESIAVGRAVEGPEVCRRGLTAAGIGPGEVGFLDVGAWPPSPDVVEGYQMGNVGTRPSEPVRTGRLGVGRPEGLTCAVGAMAALHGGPSPMGALINAALSVHRRQWVTTPAGGPSDPQVAWQGTPFHTVTNARPWFHGPECDRRWAAVFHADDAGARHVVLAEADPQRTHQPLRPCLGRATRTLIPVSGATRDRLLSRLDALRRLLEEGALLQEVARQAYTDFEHDAAFAVAVVGRDLDGALHELSCAAGGVAAAFEKGQDWLTPAGSAFTATPLGGRGVAFVYPGALNSYVGLGRDLFQHFPGLHEQLAARVSNVGRAVAEDRLYPRSRKRITESDHRAHTSALALDPPSLIESGAIFAVAHTMVLRDVFGVLPQAALGYSLGETSMLWAAGVWRDGDAGGEALRRSPLFKTRISGPKDAVREHWGLGPEEEVSWVTYLLKASVDDVQRQLQDVQRVYLTLVNQPDEVVIAGDVGGCHRVIEALACHALPIPYEVVIHCQAGYGQPATRFYSAADYDQLHLDTVGLADTMARMTCAPVDFPRLVERVYADGAGVFVELGPLADQAHSEGDAPRGGGV